MRNVRRLTRRRLVALGVAGTVAVIGERIRTPFAAAAQADGIVLEDGRAYTAYVPAAMKQGQFAQYTCEFDAAWVVLKTFGIDTTLEEQVAIIGIDERIEPYVEQTPEGYVIYGGDIDTMYSGDYTRSYLARSTGKAMRKVFDHYKLGVEPVDDRAGIEAALDRGALVWMKATVDFLPWEPVTWITPEDEELPGVLGNDHAVVAIGYNADVVVIRDVLGPTSTNWERAYEYVVPWDTFLAVWEAQGNDGVVVAPAAAGGVDADAEAPKIVPVQITGWAWPRAGRRFARSAQASRTIDQDDCRNSPAIASAATSSGQGVLVQATSPAAMTTVKLPIASFREKSQTARTLASPSGAARGRRPPSRSPAARPRRRVPSARLQADYGRSGDRASLRAR
jgi:hypothetical protein